MMEFEEVGNTILSISIHTPPPPPPPEFELGLLLFYDMGRVTGVGVVGVSGDGGSMGLWVVNDIPPPPQPRNDPPHHLTT